MTANAEAVNLSERVRWYAASVPAQVAVWIVCDFRSQSCNKVQAPAGEASLKPASDLTCGQTRGILLLSASKAHARTLEAATQQASHLELQGRQRLTLVQGEHLGLLKSAPALRCGGC